MTYLTREALLGASDTREEDVDLPSIGGKVRVRSLPAAYSNQAQSEALEMVTGRRGEQTAHINTAKLEALQVLHGLVAPKLNSIEDAYTFGQQVGQAWRTIVDKIDELSGIDKEAIEKTNAAFQSGGQSEAGGSSSVEVGARNGRSDLSVRAGA